MKEEIFGKDIPTETGYLTLDVNAGSSSSVETKGATDQKEEFPLVIKALGFEYTKEYESFSKYKEETEGVIELPIGNYEIEAHSPGEFAEKMNDPYYGGVEKIEIMSGVEKPAIVKCSIQNVKIAMDFTPEFIVLGLLRSMISLAIVMFIRRKIRIRNLFIGKWLLKPIRSM